MDPVPLKNKLYVGFLANRGVGKSTTSQELAARLRYEDINVAIISMAGPVKDFCTKLGWNGIKDDAGRNLLVAIGNGAREYCKDIWVNKHKEQVANTNCDVVFIDDIRYENEIKYIKDHNGILIHLGGGTNVDCPSEREWRTWLSNNSADFYHMGYKFTEDKNEWNEFIRKIVKTIEYTL